MFAERDGECADAVVVFVDALTALGGSQFLDSPATGRYTDYICDEIVPFVDASYPTAATREQRAVTGHSSGGYGALVLPMLRPDVFGALDRACRRHAVRGLLHVGFPERPHGSCGITTRAPTRHC